LCQGLEEKDTHEPVLIDRLSDARITSGSGRATGGGAHTVHGRGKRVSCNTVLPCDCKGKARDQQSTRPPGVQDLIALVVKDSDAPGNHVRPPISQKRLESLTTHGGSPLIVSIVELWPHKGAPISALLFVSRCGRRSGVQATTGHGGEQHGKPS